MRKSAKSTITSEDEARPLSSLFTAAELAKIIKLNEQTIYRFVRRGIIPAIRVGRKTLRFDLNDVRTALRQKPTPPRIQKPAGHEVLEYVSLDQVRERGEWPKLASTLKLKRFSVRFPTRDLTAFAYGLE